MKTEPNQYYWAIYQEDIHIIRSDEDNIGFYLHGERKLHEWGECRIIGNVSVTANAPCTHPNCRGKKNGGEGFPFYFPALRHAVFGINGVCNECLSR
jgi:hypothetical protein